MTAAAHLADTVTVVQYWTWCDCGRRILPFASGGRCCDACPRPRRYDPDPGQHTDRCDEVDAVRVAEQDAVEARRAADEQETP